MNYEKTASVLQIGNQLNVEVQINKEQKQIYFLFNQKISDDFGLEITDPKAKEIERKMMELGFDGALLQSAVEEVDLATMAFNIDDLK